MAKMVSALDFPLQKIIVIHAAYVKDFKENAPKMQTNTFYINVGSANVVYCYYHDKAGW